MNRTRALIVSLAVAVAAVAGVFALGHTVSLGAKAQPTSDAQIARRTAQLDRFEASLRTSLAQQPPPLPAVPNTTSQTSSTRRSAAPVRIVYHRPSPVVVVTHRAGGENESENEYEDEEAGADD